MEGRIYQRNPRPGSSPSGVALLLKQDLPALTSALLERYEVVAPTYSPEGRCIVLDPISSPDQLAVGYRDHQRPGHYTVRRDDGGTLFGYANGPHSPKNFLHPGRLTLFTGEWNEAGFSLSVPSGPDRPYAFLGIRPCDSFGIQVLDRTFLQVANADVRYRARREGAFVAVVNCTEPGEVCFCASMGTGPRAESGYDLRLTELADGFLLESGTDRGTATLARLPTRPATRAEAAEANRLIREAIPRMGRTLNTRNLPRILRSGLEHPYWDVMKNWCVGCSNCTNVCPTCFCNDFQDQVDLGMKTVSRERVWDSCFTMRFAEMRGVNTRDELKYRYRHWCVHKLGYWVEQYGVFGCVGCGRCLTWCPVGIDITQVATEIRGGR